MYWIFKQRRDIATKRQANCSGNTLVGMTPRADRSCWFVAMSVMLFAASVRPIFAQTSSQPCLAGDEAIYAPGRDGVEPPKLRGERAKPDNPIKLSSPVILELTLNSLGRICEIHVVRAGQRDQESARHLVQYVSDNFRFSPATRKKQPVAVRFEVTFGDGRAGGR
jgi:hypothetical protein